MSLSDWDVLAIDESGRPSNGTSESSPAGLVVEVVADALHLVSPSSWLPHSLTESPVLGVVTCGDLHLWDVRVVAERTGRAGLAWATWFVCGARLVGTVGLVCAGFDHAGLYTGVTPALVDELAARLTAWGTGGRVPRALTSLGLGNVLRFNQGDAFFARKMGHALSATPPGQADMPLLYHQKRGEHLGRIQVHAPGSPEDLAQQAAQAQQAQARSPDDPATPEHSA